ncbi:potassium channel family protein [Virgisporangium ochraceum]
MVVDDVDDGEARLRAWERRTGGALTVLGVLFLTAYAVPILSPGLPHTWHVAAEAAENVTWTALGADFAVRFRLAARRRRFLRTHLFDLIVLALPVLRPLRALRLVAIVLVMHRRAVSATRLRLSTYVGGTALLLVFVASLAVLDAERRSPDANIRSYFDAVWWTMTTLSTVGYGDRYPTTAEGRVMAMVLMVCGVGLLGFITGSLASWFIDRFSDLEQKETETRDDVADLLTEVRKLRTELGTVRAELADLRSVAPPG